MVGHKWHKTEKQNKTEERQKFPLWPQFMSFTASEVGGGSLWSSEGAYSIYIYQRICINVNIGGSLCPALLSAQWVLHCYWQFANLFNSEKHG